MAKIILKDASLVLNSVDLSDHIKSVTIDYSADQEEATAMGDDTHVNIAGLKKWSVSVEFHQDYAASSVDATLFPLVGADAFTVVIKPKSDAVSATNPSYSGSATLEDYGSVVGGDVGSLASTSVSLQSAGTLTRATS